MSWAQKLHAFFSWLFIGFSRVLLRDYEYTHVYVYIIIHLCMCLVVTVLYAPWPLCGQYYYTLTDLEWMALSRSSLLFYLESPLFLLARFLIRLNGPAPVYIETHFFPISCVAIWRCAARDCWCCRRRPPASVLGYEMIVCECNFMLFFGENQNCFAIKLYCVFGCFVLRDCDNLCGKFEYAQLERKYCTDF